MGWRGVVCVGSKYPNFFLLVWLPVSHLCFMTSCLDHCRCPLSDLSSFLSTLSCCPISRLLSLRCPSVFLHITFKGLSLLFSLVLTVLQILSLILFSNVIFCNSPSRALPLALLLSSFLQTCHSHTCIKCFSSYPFICWKYLWSSIQMLYVFQGPSLLEKLLWPLLHTRAPLSSQVSDELWVTPYQLGLHCFYWFHKHVPCLP